jgi:hypothetical protein
MQNIIHLLGLIRIESRMNAVDTATVVDAYARWVREHRGYVIDEESSQIMVCLPDPAEALASVHALMHEGERHGFTVAGGLVQAIRATEHVPRSPNDFTERTLETLIELSGAIGPQQLAISTKLLSLLQLAVPAYAAMFESGIEPVDRPVTRVRQMLVLRGERLPRYQGAIRVFDPSQRAAATD